MNRPEPHLGMRHVALFVLNLEACTRFYTELLGLTIEWQPDNDNVYLTSGNDNVALHRSHTEAVKSGQRLDHIGFIVANKDAVDQWHAFLLAHQVTMKTEPRTHRDGARSFYCEDPANNVVQIIYHPPISDRE